MYFRRKLILAAVSILLVQLSLAAQTRLSRKRKTHNVQSSSAPSNTNSATVVAAELTKGKINPAESKPGDEVTVTLKNDIRSNGEVVLKKGAAITGVVRTVKRAESIGVARNEGNPPAQSMIEVEWFAPPAAKGGENLSIALEQVTQSYSTNRTRENDSDCASRSTQDCGLVELANHSNSIVAANPALLRMPSVVAVDHQTSSSIEGDLDSSSSGPLFKVGHGELASNGATQQSVDIFSHLRNDTVITSSSRTFEISSGAQMQLLVGVNRK
jgi:hypothetical protein